MNILEALDDRNLLGASIRDAESWKPWRALLAAAFGLALDPTKPSFSASARGALRRQHRRQAISGWSLAGGAASRSPWR
jgi:hypothetical protein